MRRYLFVLKKAVIAFWEHHAFSLAAAMSFYTILSMAPLVVLLLTVAGTRLDRESVGLQLVANVNRIAGGDAADVAQTIVEHAKKPPPGRLTMILGSITLLFGATGMFNQLQDSLNFIWGVRRSPGRGLMHFLRARLTSLAMVVTVGCLLLLLPLLTAAIAVVNTHLVGKVPQIARVWQSLSLLASILILTVVFATTFKVLPYVKIKWSDVWVSAAATAVMFTAGQFFIGLYVGYSGLGSAYGAAGSLVVLLVWMHYSTLILLLGAEFTHTFAILYGSHSSSQFEQPVGRPDTSLRATPQEKN